MKALLEFIHDPRTAGDSCRLVNTFITIQSNLKRLKFKLDASQGKNSTHCLADGSRKGLGEGACKVLISHHRTRLGRLRIPAISME